jgi:hypothetical protein
MTGAPRAAFMAQAGNSSPAPAKVTVIVLAALRTAKEENILVVRSLDDAPHSQSRHYLEQSPYKNPYHLLYSII